MKKALLLKKKLIPINEIEQELLEEAIFENAEKSIKRFFALLWKRLKACLELPNPCLNNFNYSYSYGYWLLFD